MQERDIKAMVDRDKNAPCILHGSTGNEIYDARYKHGENTLDMLTGWIKEIDTTRPVGYARRPGTITGQIMHSRKSIWQKQKCPDFNYATGQYDGAHPDIRIWLFLDLRQYPLIITVVFTSWKEKEAATDAMNIRLTGHFHRQPLLWKHTETKLTQPVNSYGPDRLLR